MDLTGRHVVVVGLARSGAAAARLAAAKGARVTGLDLRESLPPIPGVQLELGPHRRETLLGADLLVVSPGIPLTQPDLAAARDAGVPILGEIGFAAAFIRAPTVAITGTNGKSTVTWFTGQLLRGAGLRTFVGGNLGEPLCNALLDPEPWDALVVEVSSYQLESAGTFHPRAGVLLNLTPDHLARHGTLDGYAHAKLRLFRNLSPTDLAVLPHGDERLARLAGDGPGHRAWLGALPGVVRAGDQVTVQIPGVQATLSLAGFRVPGDHNRDNAATAALLALALGAPAERLHLDRLEALAHRMEIVAEVGGVRWINDSKATNVDATRVGLAGLGGPAVVLLGGEAKGRGFDVLRPLLAAQRAVICFGGSGPAIADELGAPLVTRVVPWLEDAVRAARDLARPGDAVLLSPGCASFDQFTDFEHRGRVFRALVEGSS